VAVIGDGQALDLMKPLNASVRFHRGALLSVRLSDEFPMYW
jgi:hypothetical protein